MEKFKTNFPALLTFSLIDYLITGNKTMKKYYEYSFSALKGKVKIVPNYINLKRFENSVDYDFPFPKDKKVVLFVHKLSKRKGAYELVKIIKELKNEKDLFFLIIGDGPDMKKVKKDLEKYENVKFLGKIPNKYVAYFYKNSDIFIMPSLEEGFPRVVLEAMAAKKPALCYDVGGTKELIPPEFIVKKGDYKEFSKKLLKILEKYPEYKYKNLKKYDINEVLKIFTEKIING
jgi:glycosyltransferase involved in cell wall biosynthesis